MLLYVDSHHLQNDICKGNEKFHKKKKEERLRGRRYMFVTPTNILCIHNDPYL